MNDDYSCNFHQRQQFNNNNIYSEPWLTSVNMPDEYGEVPLHKAIIKNDFNMLQNILSHPDVNVNYVNYKGETPLLMSLIRFRSDDFVLCILKAGANPGLHSSHDHPIQIAVMRNTILIAHELILRGTSLNVQDEEQRSLLHIAVDTDNLEMVCMLLYYEADISATCSEGLTPLMFAFYRNRSDIANILINFYDDFSDIDCDGYTVLTLATQAVNPLALELVQAGADVNYITNYDRTALYYSLNYPTSELFRLIWDKVNESGIFNCDKPFLTLFLQMKPFDDFLDCLDLLITSPKILYLINQIDDFSDLLLGIKDLNATCRLAILSLYLSNGYQPNFDDLNLTFAHFGIENELEILIYSSEYTSEFRLATLFSPLLGFFLGMKEFAGISYHEFQSLIIDLWETQSDFKNTLNFFSISCETIGTLNEYPEFRTLEVKPVFPSLLELSRNAVYTYIHRMYNIERPYQFHDIVKNMNLPVYLQQVVQFKRHVY